MRRLALHLLLAGRVLGWPESLGIVAAVLRVRRRSFGRHRLLRRPFGAMRRPFDSPRPLLSKPRHLEAARVRRRFASAAAPAAR